MSDRLLKESDVMRIAFQLPYMVNSAFFDVVKALPSARPQWEWIPCSDRLPEENKRVLITTAWGYVTIGWVKQNIWSTDLIVNLRDFVIAWMSLPEPWKGADDERGLNKEE